MWDKYIIFVLLNYSTMNFKTLPQLLDYFKEEKTCIEHYEKLRWNGKVICPFCGHDKIYRTNRGFKCANNKCYKKFTVKVGSIFENSNISLRTFFAAIYICSAHKKGISSLQLSRDLGITQKTAWFVLHRVREMLKSESSTMLRGTIQVDETYVGGKTKNKHIAKRKEIIKSGNSLKDKTPVIGLLEKDGKVIAFVARNTGDKTLKTYMYKHVEKNSTVVTDGFLAYRNIEGDYTHIVVKGQTGRYVVDGKFHTQNIENFWSHFKRGLIGIYHYMSEKHLQRYCEEFSYRYNTRKISDAERFDTILTHTKGRLKYKDLTANVSREVLDYRELLKQELLKNLGRDNNAQA